MKKFITGLLLLCFSVVAFAHSPKIHDSAKQETKIEAVTPSNDLSFQVAVYSPLDVYAPEWQDISYSFEKTQAGHITISNKPPVQELIASNRKPLKKWIWHSSKGKIKKKIPEKQDKILIV